MISTLKSFDKRLVQQFKKYVKSSFQSKITYDNKNQKNMSLNDGKKSFKPYRGGR